MNNGLGILGFTGSIALKFAPAPNLDLNCQNSALSDSIL